MSKKEIIIDVREKDEFQNEHIEGSVLVPLSTFDQMAPGVLSHIEASKVVIMCRSGNRARLAFDRIKNLGYNDKFEFEVFTGGIMEWKNQKRPTITKTKAHLPIMRQVQLIAGLGVFIFSMLTHFVNAQFIWGAAFFGAGLAFAGASGICAMANILAYMPWNKVPSAKEELCNASPGNQSCNN